MNSAVESPCVKRCQLHPVTRSCTGCHRTLEEIGLWSSMSPEARRAVMADLPARALRSQD
nr:DUF1289 domain-containing protein [Gemmobacter serpentinus]